VRGPHPSHVPDERDDLNAVGGHCPRCLAEYRPGFQVCADCEVPLVPGPAPVEEPPPLPKGTGEMAEIATLASLPWQDAWLLAGRLRRDGIAALVSPDDYTELVRPFVGRGVFDVVVRKDQFAEARAVAARYLGRRRPSRRPGPFGA
jgi:hypothetical protein